MPKKKKVQSLNRTRQLNCTSHPLPITRALSSAHVLKAHNFLILRHLCHGKEEKWHHLWILGICVPVVIIDYGGKKMYSRAQRTTSLSITLAFVVHEHPWSDFTQNEAQRLENVTERWHGHGLTWLFIGSPLCCSCTFRQKISMSCFLCDAAFCTLRQDFGTHWAPYTDNSP